MSNLGTDYNGAPFVRKSLKWLALRFACRHSNDSITVTFSLTCSASKWFYLLLTHFRWGIWGLHQAWNWVWMVSNQATCFIGNEIKNSSCLCNGIKVSISVTLSLDTLKQTKKKWLLIVAQNFNEARNITSVLSLSSESVRFWIANRFSIFTLQFFTASRGH